MSLLLSKLKPHHKSTFRKKRIGRGNGSGWGTTAARGYKGQKARSGSKSRATFEGGQMPIWQRLPKFGFTPLSKVKFELVSLDQLAKLPEENSDLTPEVLKALRLIKKSDRPVKILNGRQSFQRVIKIKAHAFSTKAREAIEKAGGTVEVMTS